MITIRINGIDYSIHLAPQGDDKLKVGGSDRCGATWFYSGEIYILESLTPGAMRQVITHELTHAYMMAHGFIPHTKFDHEEVCDFIAAYAKLICYDTSAVIKHYGILGAEMDGN